MAQALECLNPTAEDRSVLGRSEAIMPPIIDRKVCVGCGTCADICNSHIFVHDRTVDKVPVVKFPDECWHCDSCVMDCPVGAIRLRIPLPYSLLHVRADSLRPRPAGEPASARGHKEKQA